MTTLRKPRNAAAYCLKGIRYSAKGVDGNQGKVWGRRYGVSKALCHTEIRTEHEDSAAAAFEIVSIANELREQGKPRCDTAYGCFTPRGFYARDGITYRQIIMAARIASVLLAESRGARVKAAESAPF